MVNRITRHQAFMQTAEVFARRSTCMRRSVGAVIVCSNHIISHGYNGAPAGMPHCSGADCASPDKGCTRAIHAEKNAIDYIADILLAPADLTMYCTESPCSMCASWLADKIGRFYYLHLYRDPAGVNALAKLIPTFRMTPSGFIINHLTGELVDE